MQASLRALDAAVFPGEEPRPAASPCLDALDRPYILPRRVACPYSVKFFVYNVPLWHLHALGEAMARAETRIAKAVPALEARERGLRYEMRVAMREAGEPLENVKTVNEALRRATRALGAAYEEVAEAAERARWGGPESRGEAIGEGRQEAAEA